MLCLSSLSSLHRHLRRKVLLVWGRLSAHRARLTTQSRASQGHWLRVEWLPAYAPELKSVEYLCAHLKAGDSANFCTHEALIFPLTSVVERAACEVETILRGASSSIPGSIHLLLPYARITSSVSSALVSAAIDPNYTAETLGVVPARELADRVS